MKLEVEPDGFRIPINQSLVRDKLFLGGERTLVLGCVAPCALVFATSDVRAYILAGIFWGMCLAACVAIAKYVDPIASKTIERFWMHPKQYAPAQPSIVAVSPAAHEYQ